jgi:peptide/nickel transport system permease protein
MDWLIFLTALATIVASAWFGQAGAARRALSVVAVLFGATLIVTGMVRLVPGDPIESILGDQAPQDAREALAKQLGLIDDEGRDVGFVGQYGHFSRGVFASAVLVLPGTSGLKESLPDELSSYRTRKPVREAIVANIGNTAELAFVAMLIAIILGPLLGVLAAWRRGRFLDGAAMVFAVAGVAIPRPWLGPLLILAFALGLRWFPVSGDEGFSSVVLPAISLGTALAAVLARLTRASMLEVLSQDFIRTARAKGLSEKVVLFKHALRNALIPILTVVGLQLGAILGGAVVTEQIFARPGLGLLLLENIKRLDVPVVQGCVLTIAFGYVIVNLLTDLLYAQVDPRIRIQ